MPDERHQKAHAAQEAEEQRRIADGGEAAAGIAHDEDEEHTWKPVMRTLFHAKSTDESATWEAPVVPITFAMIAPISRKTVFTMGVASPAHPDVDGRLEMMKSETRSAT